MSTFLRRFSFDPGDEVLLEIESVNILDLDPPASLSGIGSGTALLVGEFEDGPFATGGNAMGQPTDGNVREVSGTTDFVQTYGMLGYTYGGVPSNNPCARARKADSALNPEYWNGNGFIQLSGKRFARLVLARVDTSVGSATFTRRATIVSALSGQFTYNLEPAQTLVVTDQGTDRTATFSAAAASVTSGSATYASITAGATLTLGYDSAPDFTVTFLAGDTTQANVLARINQYAGFTFATAASGTTHSLTGIQRGGGGQVRVVAGSAGVLAALGNSAATTFGTGNVANIDAVTFQEIKTVVEAAMVAGPIKVSQDSSGALRLEKVYASGDDWMLVKSTTTATGLGFAAGEEGSNSGYAYVRSAAGTYPTSFAGGETLTLGNDDAANFTVVFSAGDTTQALIIARINQYAGYAAARAISGTVIEFRGNANGGSFRVVAGSAGVFTALGLAATTATATAVSAGSIPAGTVVQTSSGSQKFVTMQTVSVSASAIAGVAQSGPGPYSVKLRHALDDGTGTSAGAGTLVALERAIDLAGFEVTNPALVNAALSEAAIDAAYSAAFDKTRNTNDVGREVNMCWSARQSNACRKFVRTNVISASEGGCFGRVGCVRPPLGTSRAAALSGSAEPGVGATRSQRVIYNYPGVNTFVPAIAARGLSGGAGFTADGNVDVGSDGFCCSVMSQLPPEENPGQSTSFTTQVNGLESNDNAQGFEENDYKNFRAKGICAPRMDDGVCIFQSGVTSVDPGTYPQLRNIARRRMADFIQDTVARRGKGYGKKLMTFSRRKAYATEIRNFLRGLLSADNPDRQRIAGFTVNTRGVNTPESLGKGIYRVQIKVRTLSSMDSIVLETTIGELVEVEETIKEAA